MEDYWREVRSDVSRPEQVVKHRLVMIDALKTRHIFFPQKNNLFCGSDLSRARAQYVACIDVSSVISTLILQRISNHCRQQLGRSACISAFLVVTLVRCIKACELL